VPVLCRSREQRGRGNTWSGAEKDFCHTDANSAPKEKSRRGKEKIANTDSDPKLDIVAVSFTEKEKDFAVT